MKGHVAGWGSIPLQTQAHTLDPSLLLDMQGAAVDEFLSLAMADILATHWPQLLMRSMHTGWTSAISSALV